MLLLLCRDEMKSGVEVEDGTWFLNVVIGDCPEIVRLSKHAPMLIM